MTMAALISHVVGRAHLAGGAVPGGDKTQNPSFDETDEDANWRTDGISLKQLLAQYEAQCDVDCCRLWPERLGRLASASRAGFASTNSLR
jgi:hypothetical protein